MEYAGIELMTFCVPCKQLSLILLDDMNFIILIYPFICYQIYTLLSTKSKNKK